MPQDPDPSMDLALLKEAGEVILALNDQCDAIAEQIMAEQEEATEEVLERMRARHAARVTAKLKIEFWLPRYLARGSEGSEGALRMSCQTGSLLAHLNGRRIP